MGRGLGVKVGINTNTEFNLVISYILVSKYLVVLLKAYDNEEVYNNEKALSIILTLIVAHIFVHLLSNQSCVTLREIFGRKLGRVYSL